MPESARALPIAECLCNWTGCGHTSEARVAERPLCLQHFFEFSYRRMNAIRRVLDDSGPDRELIGDAQIFLSQVVSQTTQLATQIKLLDPALRDHLLALSTAAAELYNRVRRAPRLPRRINCLLRSGIVSPEISERCTTLNISQRGACLELSSPHRSGREITLERLDLNRSARVKIAWVKDSPDGRFLAGVEILDHDDFWGLTAATTSTSPKISPALPA